MTVFPGAVSEWVESRAALPPDLINYYRSSHTAYALWLLPESESI